MPSISLAVSLRGQLLSGTRAFDPATLFSAGEQGVWYDPSDVANLAWRRNLLTYSQDLSNAAWLQYNGTPASNTTTAPDGTITADTWQISGSSSAVYRGSWPFVLDETNNVSVHLKAGTNNFAALVVGSGGLRYVACVIDLTNGSVANVVSVGASVVGVPSSTALGNGWYRLNMSFTNMGSTQHVKIEPAPLASGNTFDANADITGNTAGNTFFIWGAQLELGSVATDYQRITDVNTEVIERFPTATLFTDTAGTIPVTTPGQAVALMLDKSRGLVLGPELVVNGDFSSGTTGWTSGTTYSGTLSAASGLLTITTNSANGFGSALQSVSLTVGKTYRLTGTRRASSGGNPAVGFGNSLGAIQTVLISGSASTTTNEFTASFVYTGNILTLFNQTSTNGAVSEFDNISVRELAGNHATQATAASRPIYGVVPQGGRRNLLTWSEDYSNAIWAKSNATVTVNSEAAPDGTLTADLQTQTAAGGFFNQSVTGAVSTTYTASAWFKAGTASFGTIYIGGGGVGGVDSGFTVNLSTGATQKIGSGAITAVATSGTAGWWRLAVTFTTGGSDNSFDILLRGQNTSPTESAAVTTYIWGAQLEQSATATPYQRVSTIYDVTEAGVQSCSYLFFNGTNNSMATNTITPGTDKVQVFAGARKLRDTTTAILVELSSSFSNTGSFGVVAPSSNGQPDLQFVSTGTAQVAPTATGFASPVTVVLTGLSDISGDFAGLRANGSQVAQSTGNQGSGNYLAYPLYIGARTGTNLYFNGNLFGLITRFGPNLTGTTINATEYWVGDKTGINIANNISPTIFARDDTAVLDRFNQIIERRA